MLSADHPTAVAFASAIVSGDTRTLAALLAATPSLAQERFGDTQQNRSSLHVLTDWPGNTPQRDTIARLLVEHGADVNAAFVGSHPESPLHWAASSDDALLVNTLVRLGANIEAPGGVLTGGPPMDDAIIFQQWKAAEALVQLGAKVSFWHSAALGRDDLIQRSIHDPATPLPTQQELDNALWHSAASGHLTTATLLLELGASAAWVGWDHLTAARAAQRNGHSALSDFLTQA